MPTELSSIRIADQLTLRIGQEIRQQMDSILENINKIATEYKIADEDKKSPFRNVLAVAVEPSSSLEIIKNYIRYQVGRGSNASPIWSLRGGKDQKLFAQELVNALDNLSEDVDQILARVRESLTKLSEKDITDLAGDLSENESLASGEPSQEESISEEKTDIRFEETIEQKDLDSESSLGQNDLLNYLTEDSIWKALKRSLHLELAQLYLGYIAREHTAQVGEKKAKSQSPGEKTSEQKQKSSRGNPKIPDKPVRN